MYRDEGAAFDLVLSSDPEVLLYMFSAMCLMSVIRAVSIQLSYARNVSLGIHHWWAVAAASSFLNQFLFSAAGVAYRAVYLKRQSIPYRDSIIAQFYMLAVATFSATALLLAVAAVASAPLGGLFAGTCLLLVASLIASLLIPALVNRSKRSRLISRELSAENNGLYSGMQLPKLFALSTLGTLVVAFAFYFGLSATVRSVTTATACASATTISNVVILTPGNLGVWESSTAAVALLSNVSLDEIVAATILVRVANYLACTLTGVIGFVILRMSPPSGPPPVVRV